MDKKKVILDCDTGLDDAIAVAMLTAIEEFDVLGICTVAGNVELHKTTQNTLDVLHYLNKDVDVYSGVDKPLERDLEVAYDFHGESGIGSIKLEKSSKTKMNIDAIEFMAKSVRENKGEVHIVAVGPITNVATLIKKYPELESDIGSITFMGGSMVGGNVTEHAEFNVFCDPEATKIVVDSRVPTTMIGLDATMKAKLFREDVKFLEQLNHLGARLTKEFHEEMLNVRGNMGYEFAVFHDSIAVISLIKDDLFNFKEYNLAVDLEGDRLGKTYEDMQGRRTRVAMDFDKDGFIKYIKEIFA